MDWTFRVKLDDISAHRLPCRANTAAQSARHTDARDYDMLDTRPASPSRPCSDDSLTADAGSHEAWSLRLNVDGRCNEIPLTVHRVQPEGHVAVCSNSSASHSFLYTIAARSEHHLLHALHHRYATCEVLCTRHVGAQTPAPVRPAAAVVVVATATVTLLQLVTSARPRYEFRLDAAVVRFVWQQAVPCAHTAPPVPPHRPKPPAPPTRVQMLMPECSDGPCSDPDVGEGRVCLTLSMEETSTVVLGLRDVHLRGAGAPAGGVLPERVRIDCAVVPSSAVVLADDGNAMGKPGGRAGRRVGAPSRNAGGSSEATRTADCPTARHVCRVRCTNDCLHGATMPSLCLPRATMSALRELSLRVRLRPVRRRPTRVPTALEPHTQPILASFLLHDDDTRDTRAGEASEEEEEEGAMDNGEARLPPCEDSWRRSSATHRTGQEDCAGPFVIDIERALRRATVGRDANAERTDSPAGQRISRWTMEMPFSTEKVGGVRLCGTLTLQQPPVFRGYACAATGAGDIAAGRWTHGATPAGEHAAVHSSPGAQAPTAHDAATETETAADDAACGAVGLGQSSTSSTMWDCSRLSPILRAEEHPPSPPFMDRLDEESSGRSAASADATMADLTDPATPIRRTARRGEAHRRHQPGDDCCCRRGRGTGATSRRRRGQGCAKACQDRRTVADDAAHARACVGGALDRARDGLHEEHPPRQTRCNEPREQPSPPRQDGARCTWHPPHPPVSPPALVSTGAPLAAAAAAVSSSLSSSSASRVSSSRSSSSLGSELALDVLLRSLFHGEVHVALHLMRAKPALVHQSNSVLHVACAAAVPSAQAVERIVQLRPDLLFGVDETTGDTALHIACAGWRHGGDDEAAATRTDVAQADPKRASGSMSGGGGGGGGYDVAAHVAVVRVLLHYGASTRVYNHAGLLPFHVALLNPRDDATEHFLASVFVEHHVQDSSRHHCRRHHGSNRCLDRAAEEERGAAPEQPWEARTAAGHTPLLLVCQSDDHVSCVRYLLSRGSSLLARGAVIHCRTGRVSLMNALQLSRHAGAMAVHRYLLEWSRR